MSEFLLLGTRPLAGGMRPPAGEVSPRNAARDLVAVQGWHQGLRRWGLLRSFALPPDAASADPFGADPVGPETAGPETANAVRVCLIVHASGDRAARRLAAGWGRVSGYRVSVLPLRGVPGGRRLPEGRPRGPVSQEAS